MSSLLFSAICYQEKSASAVRQNGVLSLVLYLLSFKESLLLQVACESSSAIKVALGKMLKLGTMALSDLPSLA